jgi:hypothetical protein
LAVQNEVPAADLGIATSAVNFFRAIGGSVGVALIGALFTSRLTTVIAGLTPGRTDLQPADVHALSPEGQARYLHGFAHVLAGSFVYVIPLSVAAVVFALLLRETPLRQHIHTDMPVDAL